LPAGKFAEEEKPKEIENNGGNRPGQDGSDKACTRRSRNLDAFGGELIGDRRIDPDCHKFVFAVRPWLLERAFNHIGVDDDLGDFFVGHELFELAIGNSLGLPRRIPDLLQEQRGENRRDDVPDRPSLLLIEIHGRFLRSKTQGRGSSSPPCIACPHPSLLVFAPVPPRSAEVTSALIPFSEARGTSPQPAAESGADYLGNAVAVN
jgi:hypothetical protein